MNESGSNKGWRVPVPAIFENQTFVNSWCDIKFAQVESSVDSLTGGNQLD